uniref:Uncharacterized protein n=1 Tax=Anguilla anguilla TaxID=7936 RepID=A0A0E9U1F8_ANGAN
MTTKFGRLKRLLKKSIAMKYEAMPAPFHS